MMATLAAPRPIETPAARSSTLAPTSLVRNDMPSEPGRYETRRNLPAILPIAALHVAIGAVLFSTDMIAIRPTQRAPIVIEMLPAAEITQPAEPSPPAPRLATVAAEVAAPKPIVETPPTSSPTATTVETRPALPVAVAASSVKATSPAPTAPVTPPDFAAGQLDNPAPRYPTLSRRNHEQGIVEIKVLVSPEGRAQEASVAKSSGFERLDKAALDAVRKWRFKPATQSGQAVAAWVLVPIPFVLNPLPLREREGEG